MENQDEEFKGEPPDIKACLMHEVRESVETFVLGGLRCGYGGVHYGLCLICVRVLKDHPEFKNKIKKEIDDRLTKLKSGRKYNDTTTRSNRVSARPHRLDDW